MRLVHLKTPVGLLAALALTVAPAFAQDRARGRGNHEESGRAEARGRTNERQQRDAMAPRERTRENDRAIVGQRAVPRRDVIVSRQDRPTVIAPRGVHPSVVRPYSARPPYYARPYYSRPYYSRPYIVRPYVFRPRFQLRLGIFAGYPVAYTYAYPYPVPVYGYGAPAAPVVVGPGSVYYGGVSLEFSPGDAAVYVDGNYAGVVDDFDGTRQPLNLPAGMHHIELQAPGFEPMAFDVNVQPGQVIPYRGDLRPY